MEIAVLKRENKELSQCKKKCEDLTIENKRLEERNLVLTQQYLRSKQDMEDTQQHYLKDFELLEKERQGLLIRNQLLDEVYSSEKVKDRKKLFDVIGRVILSFIGILMKGTHVFSHVRAVADLIFKNELFGAEPTRAVLKEIAAPFIRESVFVPWKILCAMDLSPSGAFNYQGLETLREIEDLENCERGVLPCSSLVKRCAYELHRLGDECIPFKQVNCQLGELFQFDYERILRFMLKVFKIHEKAQCETVEFSFTLDGAVLTDHLSHLTAGLKVTDLDAVDPRTSIPISREEDGVFGRIYSNQGRNYCFVLKSLLGKDMKAAYQEFKDLIDFFDKVMQEGIPASKFDPVIKRLNIWSPQDMSSIWKCLNTGCGAKKRNETLFCHLCPCQSRDIVFFKTEQNRCNRYKHLKRARCFHWDVLDEDSIERFRELLRQKMGRYLESYGKDFEHVKKRSKIVYQPSAVNKQWDSMNIEFVPAGESELEERAAFGTLVMEELRLRQLSLSGNFEERRARLKEVLALEQTIKLMQRAVQRNSEGKEAALLLIKQVPPCIMHLENRIGEKIITMLIGYGAMRYQQRNTISTLKHYAKNIEEVVNTKILGTVHRPKQWKMTLSKDSKDIGPVSLSNKKTRRFMDNLGILLNFIFDSDSNEVIQQKKMAGCRS